MNGLLVIRFETQNVSNTAISLLFIMKQSPLLYNHSAGGERFFIFIKGYHYTKENIFDKIFSNLIETSRLNDQK